MTLPTSDPTQDADGSGNQPGGERTFTQQELNQLVADRIKREREKYADYDDLKGKASKWAELEEKQKSEEQKLREKLELLETEKQAVTEKANRRILEAEFIRAATVAGVKYPRDAYLLAQADGLAFGLEDDKVVGVEEAVKSLLEKGRLVLDKPRAPSLDGGAGGSERAGERLPGLTEDEKAQARKMGITEQQYAAAKKR